MTIKQERVQELIQAHLGSILLIEATDPALKNITVTDVRVDREIQYADIYVHALANDKRRGQVMGGLKRANGFLRKKLSERLRLRQIPVLHFHWDQMLEDADRMEKLLDDLDIKPETPAEDDNE